MRQAPNPFWRHSLRVYRRPGVEQACLALQDRCGADVNLLLFCGWIGQSGVALDRRRLRQAMARVGRWQTEVIQPLRGARRAVKHRPPPGLAPEMAQALRGRLGSMELELEQIEQALLADLAAGWPPPRRRQTPAQAIGASLARYISLLVPAPEPEDLRLAAVLASTGLHATAKQEKAPK